MTTEKRHIDNHLMLERLSKIHAKIKSGCYPNTLQLAFDNEVSVLTISRDFEFLRDRFGADIQYNATQRGYYYTKNFEMPLNLISSKDFLFLSLVKQLITQYEGSPIYKEISSNIDLVQPTKFKLEKQRNGETGDLSVSFLAAMAEYVNPAEED